MRHSAFIALFASAILAQNTPSAGAQNSATVLNLFNDVTQLSILTVLGSDASATTYQNSCPSDAAGVSAVPSDQLTDSPTQTDDDFALPTTDFTSILPFDTPAPRTRRQADASGDDISFCEPYTLIQGPQTYEMHLTDPSPGVWTMNIACNWKGEIMTADLTCTLTQSGDLVASSEQGSETSVVPQSDVQDLYQTVALVGATGSSSAASQTPTGSRSSSGTVAPTKSASGSGAAAKSTGLAPAGPLQKGAILGGAVGILAVALAL